MLEEIVLDQLLEYKLSPGDLYWCRPSGKESKILCAGEMIDETFLFKYSKGACSIKIDWVIDKNNFNLGKAILEKLKISQFEKDREAIRKEFTIFLEEVYWIGEKKGSPLDLILLIEFSFNEFSKEQLSYLNDIGIDLYKRSALVAALNVVFSFMAGYMDYKFLNEIYYISFYSNFLDYIKPMPIKMIKTLDNARHSPQEAIEKLSKEDQSHFMSLMNTDYKGVKFDKIYNFKIPGVMKMIERVREKIKSGGLPLNLNEGELSDIEKIIIMNNEAIPYFKEEFDKIESMKLFKRIFDGLTSSGNKFDVDQRIKDIIEQRFDKKVA